MQTLDEKTRRGWVLPLIFVLIAAPFLAILALVTPPGEVPDEAARLMRADGLLSAQVLARRSTFPHGDVGLVPSAGVFADPGLLSATFFLRPALDGNSVNPANLARARSERWGAPIYVHIPNTAVYGPVFYVPGAVALAGARVAGLEPFGAIFAVRLVNAGVYLILGALALLVARHGRPILLGCLILPMSLALAASASQDGALLAATVLAVALLTGADAEGRLSPSRLWSAALLLAAVAAAKPVYLPLAVLLLLPLRLIAERLPAACVALLVPLAWVAVTAAVVAVPFPKEPYVTGPLAAVQETLWMTDPGRQVSILLDTPGLFATLPAAAVGREAWLWWMQLVGVLGPNALLLPKGLYRAWAVVAVALPALGLLWSRPAPGQGRSREADPLTIAAVLGIGLGTAWLIVVAQYLTWTPVGATVVEGVQGRYFIPLLALLPLAIPRIAARPGGKAEWLCVALLAILGIVGGVMAVEVVLDRYHRAG